MAHVQPPAAEVWHSLSSFPVQAAAKHINIVYLVSYGYEAFSVVAVQVCCLLISVQK